MTDEQPPLPRQRFADFDIELREEAMAAGVPLIAELVERGEFLSHPHTRSNWRHALSRVSPLIDRGSHGDWEAAVEELQQALERKGDSGARVRTYGMNFINYLPYLKLGIAYYHLQKYREAIQAYQRADDPPGTGGDDHLEVDPVSVWHYLSFLIPPAPLTTDGTTNQPMLASTTGSVATSRYSKLRPVFLARCCLFIAFPLRSER